MIQATLLVFFSSFISVFALGFQSLNVNQGRHLLASVTSLVICTGSLFLFQQLPTAGFWPIAAYFLGCNLGINSSMWVHPRLNAWLADWRARRRLRNALRARRAQMPAHPMPKMPPAGGYPGDTH